ncbi:MAG: NAD(P)-binding protein [Gammaproteobacteria bacterium]|nr:NAD(P)-binding protein [Gammaproteobacteria bacterium]
MHTIDTDYLVVGAGAAGMAFTDALLSHCDADVVMVDRRHAPGGHWHDAYPFVRLHQPSATYGVDSRPLGNDAPVPRVSRPGARCSEPLPASAPRRAARHRWRSIPGC